MIQSERISGCFQSLIIPKLYSINGITSTQIQQGVKAIADRTNKETDWCYIPRTDIYHKRNVCALREVFKTAHNIMHCNRPHTEF